MLLHIHKDTAIKDIQHLFAELYPFLKIEFYKIDGPPGKTLEKKEEINERLFKDDFNNTQVETIINIQPKRTVLQVEKDFRQQCNISIKVFRKCRNLWIQTSLTDDWSLERQNNEAALISMAMNG